MAGFLRMLLSARPHVAFSMLLFLLMAAMVVQPEQHLRAGLFIASLLSFLGFTILFGLEVDAAARSPSRRVAHAPLPLIRLPSVRSLLTRPRLPNVRLPTSGSQALLQFFSARE